MEAAMYLPNEMEENEAFIAFRRELHGYLRENCAHLKPLRFSGTNRGYYIRNDQVQRGILAIFERRAARVMLAGGHYSAPLNGDMSFEEMP